MNILYKKAKTGKIVSYDIRVNNLGDSSEIIKLTGQIDGKKIEHKDIIAVGKNLGKSNETTHYQQALSQAKSDWLKKKDEGYKESTEELEEFNTDALGNMKPMLAHDATKHKSKVVFPCMIQPKYDGVRAMISINTALSRKGKEFTTLSHIQEELERMNVGLSVVFDGEIYSDELTFQEITSAIKKFTPNTLKLKYRVYDLLTLDNAVKRQKMLSEEILESDVVINTGYMLVNSWEEVAAKFSDYISQGYEGAMLRSLDGVYDFGQRSYSLLKYKEFDEEEFRFVSWEVGKRKEDLIANLLTSDGKAFKAKMVGTVVEKESLRLLSPELITIKYFGLTDDGIPRFPIGKAVRDYE